MKEENTKCPCRKLNCPRHGNCGECREYHKGPGEKWEPACERKRKKDEGEYGGR